ncbi:MAG: hypothetical protein ACK4RV_10215 [Caulobacter sp.]
MNERARAQLISLATWTELSATVERLVAATLRNDAKGAEELRRQAHDILDQHFDAKIAGIAAIRADIERQFNKDL